MYASYTVVTVLAFLIASPYFLYQAIRYRKYVASVPQRLGRLPVAFNLVPTRRSGFTRSRSERC